MPNHLHILLFQGHAPLGWTLQPILRRTALMVQRTHGVQGHVFERRFRSKLCADHTHLRNSILYIHRNPIEAGLCADAADYSSTSHRAYATGEDCSFIHVEEGLRIVACCDSGSPDELRAIYLSEFARYCGHDVGDAFSWTYTERRRFRRESIRCFSSQSVSNHELPDLRDAALMISRQIDPNCDIELVRSAFRGSRVLEIRLQLIATLLLRGYSGRNIAAFLRISESSVSRVRCRLRWEQIA